MREFLSPDGFLSLAIGIFIVFVGVGAVFVMVAWALTFSCPM